jgi:hypothetical protein
VALSRKAERGIFSRKRGEERKIKQEKIHVAPGEEEILLLSFPLWICLDLDSNLDQIVKSNLQLFCCVHAVFVQAVFRGH